MNESKIIQLKAENVKRLKAVTITPDGNLVVIGGKNGAGKSSCLDSIYYALAGGKSLPKVPVRRGEEKATVELDLGELVVKRTFTAAGGTSLTVTNKQGLKYPSPQAILDALVGTLSFDPLEFARATASEQSQTLKTLVGLDFSAKEKERQSIYAERTAVNHQIRSLESRIASLPQPKAGIPAEETSTESILKEQEEAQEKNAQNLRARMAARQLMDTAKRLAVAENEARIGIEELEAEVIRLQERVTAKKKEKADIAIKAEAARQRAEKAEQEITALKDVDVTPFVARLRDVEQTNRIVRQNKERATLIDDGKAKQKLADELSAKLDRIDDSKRESIAAAKFPVEGLSVNEDGEVLFNGLPFSQASSAEQLRVSVAIGLALNPKLRVILIRDGSLLDEDGLRLIADMAEKAEAQVWIERVETDGHVSVIIEDGMVSAAVSPDKPKPQLDLVT